MKPGSWWKKHCNIYWKLPAGDPDRYRTVWRIVRMQDCLQNRGMCYWRWPATGLLSIRVADILAVPAASGGVPHPAPGSFWPSHPWALESCIPYRSLQCIPYAFALWQLYAQQFCPHPLWAVIIPGASEPSVRTLRATIPENESQPNFLILVW